MAAPSIGTGVIDVVFDPKQVEQAGREQVLPSAKRIAADVASTFAAVKFINFGKQGLDELKQAQAAQSNVEAVIRSTGGAAGVSAQHVDELANSQLKLTGTDDEVIKQGAAKLLTFKQVANQVGVGNDVFDRATKLSLDLAQLGFGSVESSSVLLGKALNDPVKGLTALQRVGVALTDSQKEQVKAFVASGDVLSAQKVILQEVESQVGGAAQAYGETLPGKIDIAKQSLENMKGAAVAGAAPAIELLAGGATFLADKFSELPEPLQETVGGIGLLAAAAGALVSPVRDTLQVLDLLSAKREAKSAAAAEEVVTNQALATSEAEVAAGEKLVATNSSAAVTGLEAEAVAAQEAAGGMSALSAAMVLVAAPVAATVGLKLLSDQLGLTDGLTDHLAERWKEADAALKNLGDDLEHFNSGKVVSDLDKLIQGNEDFATALNHAHVNTSDVTLAITAGGDAWAQFADRVKHTEGVTKDDVIAFGQLAKAIDDNAHSALNAAVASGQLDQAQLDAASSQHTFKDGTTDFIGVLNDLAGKGLISKEAVQGVRDAAQQEIDTKQQEALATWYKTIADNADKAEEAALKLAPANIRVQRGRLNLEDDKRDIALAEDKVNFLKAAKAPTEEIAAAERDLEGKRLDLQQATLDQAEAEKELTAQLYEAAGLPLTLQQQTDVYNTSLQHLAENLTGPVRDALAGYIWQETLAANAARTRATEQEAASKFVPPSPDIGTIPGGGFDPRLVPEPRRSTGVPGPRAAGGPVTAGETYLVGEEGPELFTAARSGRIIPHADVQRLAEESQRAADSFVEQGYGVGKSFVESVHDGMLDPKALDSVADASRSVVDHAVKAANDYSSSSNERALLDFLYARGDFTHDRYGNPSPGPGWTLAEDFTWVPPGYYSHRATGGSVGSGQMFRGAEEGYEVLLTDGMYQAPPGGGYVLNHAQSQRFVANSGRGGVNIANVNVYGDDAPRALRKLPDELRAAAFLAGV